MEIVNFNTEKLHKIVDTERNRKFNDHKFLIGREVKIDRLSTQMGRCITGFVIFQDNLKTTFGSSLYVKGGRRYFENLELEEVKKK